MCATVGKKMGKQGAINESEKYEKKKKNNILFWRIICFVPFSLSKSYDFDEGSNFFRVDDVVFGELFQEYFWGNGKNFIH